MLVIVQVRQLKFQTTTGETGGGEMGGKRAFIDAAPPPALENTISPMFRLFVVLFADRQLRAHENPS